MPSLETTFWLHYKVMCYTLLYINPLLLTHGFGARHCFIHSPLKRSTTAVLLLTWPISIYIPFSLFLSTRHIDSSIPFQLRRQKKCERNGNPIPTHVLPVVIVIVSSGRRTVSCSFSRLGEGQFIFHITIITTCGTTIAMATASHFGHGLCQSLIHFFLLKLTIYHCRRITLHRPSKPLVAHSCYFGPSVYV